MCDKGKFTNVGIRHCLNFYPDGWKQSDHIQSTLLALLREPTLRSSNVYILCHFSMTSALTRCDEGFITNWNYRKKWRNTLTIVGHKENRSLKRCVVATRWHAIGDASAAADLFYLGTPCRKVAPRWRHERETQLKTVEQRCPRHRLGADATLGSVTFSYTNILLWFEQIWYSYALHFHRKKGMLCTLAFFRPRRKHLHLETSGAFMQKRGVATHAFWNMAR